MNTDTTTYLVKVGGCPVGTVTTLGTITATTALDINTREVTFASGETRTFRYNQALCVVTS